SSVRLAAPAQDFTSKEFVVPLGKALIYVVRDGGFIYGAYQLFRISLDRRDYGPLAEGTYFVFPVDPGPHAVMAAWKENVESIQIPADAGRIYFVSVQSARPRMTSYAIVGEPSRRRWASQSTDRSWRP